MKICSLSHVHRLIPEVPGATIVVDAVSSYILFHLIEAALIAAD
jgi:hypothetical protein